MMLARLRGAAIGGLAVLLLSGAGIAFAGNSTPAPALVTPPVVAAAPAAGVSTATGRQVDVQQGDQTAPDTAGTAATEQTGVEAPESATEAAGNSTPVVAAAPAGVSTASGQQVDVQQGDQTAPDAAGAATTEQAGVEAPESATEAAGTETDGPGGHADTAGSNVDYQFQGEQ